MSEDKYFPIEHDPELPKKLATTAQLISQSKHLTVFTGAGISTESGLPDYRGPQGVWTLRDQGKRALGPGVAWSEVAPNSGHMVLYQLQEMGILKFLISQNVDSLHLKSGISPDKIAELHGNSTLMKCLQCDKRFSKPEIGWDAKLFGKGYRTQKPVKGQPKCSSCQGRIISSVVNFGDSMPEKEMRLAQEHSMKADVFLAIGSTLRVTPAADFPIIAKQNRQRAKLIILNLGETALDDEADVRISGKCGEILEQILQLVQG